MTPKNWWCYLPSLFLQGDPIATAVVQEYLESIQQLAKMPSLDEWYNISNYEIPLNWLDPIEYLGGLAVVLKLTYPTHPWAFPSDIFQHPSMHAADFNPC